MKEKNKVRKSKVEWGKEGYDEGKKKSQCERKKEL